MILQRRLTLTALFLLVASLALLGASGQETPIPASKAQMKAIRFHEYGAPEVLVYEDAPKPVPTGNEVLVRVHAASVNPVDWKIRKGGLSGLNTTFPQIPGFDVSGVIEGLGPEVKRSNVGDNVYCYLSLKRGGGYAEFVVLPETEVALKPKSIDHVHAAAVPLAALTAWQALFDKAKLKEGQTVLIHGGAGGVGHFAVQLAKAVGAKVIATASENNLEFLKEIGADQVINYKTQKFEDIVKDVDVVLDTVGATTLARSYAVVKKGGFVVSIVEAPNDVMLSERGARGAVILVMPNAKELNIIGGLIDAGQMRPHVSKVLPLTEARQAQELSETGHTRGKIVLEVITP